MTTQIGDRFWTYYPNGIYPCTCFFCKDGIETGTPRWHSRLPTSVYCCNDCFDGSRVLPGLYPETHQRQFSVERASEVVVDARTPETDAIAALERVIAPTARETRISNAHEENMESARQTRNCIALLVTAINELTKAVKGKVVE